MDDADQLKKQADAAFRAGQFDVARQAYQKALAVRPKWAAAHNNLAMVLRVAGDAKGAEENFRAAVEADPDLAGAWSNLGAMLFEQSRQSEALEILNRALALEPGHAGSLYNRAKVSRVLGQDSQEIEDLESAVRLVPDFAEALSDLGRAYYDAGRDDDAEQTLRTATNANPRLAEAKINLGIVLSHKGQTDAAIAMYHEAIALEPRNAPAHYNLGKAYSLVPAHSAALEAYKTALDIDPAYDDAANNMSGNLQVLGRAEEAKAALEQALQINPRFADAESNVLLIDQYLPATTPQSRFARAQDWQAHQRGAVFATAPGFSNSKDPDRPLRVGFVSPNLSRHPVGYFVLPLVQNYDRHQLSLTFYCENPRDDEITDRIRTDSAAWRLIQKTGHADLARQIIDDQIDILVDLAGHTGFNRMPVFADRAAPVQMTWAGYVGTTGLDAMDYLLTDARQTVSADLPFMTEQPVYMPGNYVAFETPTDAPAPQGPPMDRNGFVTFGCFNNIKKMNEGVVVVWSQIMAQCLDSRLFMVTRDLGDADVRQHILDLFRAQGINTDRLVLEGRRPRVELLAAYNDIDIALDPFPYSGGLTTLEALWMGVPVVTRRDSDRFAGRHSTAHLTAAGCPELIAKSAEDYVGKAVALAQAPDRVQSYRQSLRDQVARSPACDGAAFAQHFAAACRVVWQRWCKGEALSPVQEADIHSVS